LIEEQRLGLKKPEEEIIQKELKIDQAEEKKESVEITPPKTVKETKEEKADIKSLKDEPIEKRIEEKTTELKLHESLLPVKDEKDKKIVKEYFSKIFNVLSKDLREQIIALEIPKKDKNELLKELAFLTAEEQAKYIESIGIMYREIPKKLIQRIKNLPNVKPQHYDKIVEQLKFMNNDEQIEFVQFLEDNA